MRALLEELGVVVGRVAVDHDDLGVGLAIERGQERGPLQSADGRVVERQVVVEVGRAEDQPVIRDDRDVLGLGLGHDRRGSRAVDGVEHEHAGPVGQGSLSLRLLRRRVLVGVAVDQVRVGVEAE